MKQNYCRTIIYPSDVARYYKITLGTAYRRYQAIRSKFNLPKGNTISVSHFAHHNKLTVRAIYFSLFGEPMPDGYDSLPSTDPDPQDPN